jgi:hypothetical protein
MRVRRILALLIVALVLSVGPGPLVSVARAARITAPGLNITSGGAWPTDPVLCDLVLDGEIEEGDAASLEQKFRTIVPEQLVRGMFLLCLRSNGGDTGEAVKIAQFMMRIDRAVIATVIEDGQTCASACAIIFLAGRWPLRVGALPYRFLHPRGRLLYHSTHVELTKFSDKELLAFLTEPTTDPRGLKGKIADIYKYGLRDVQGVMATFKKSIFSRDTLGDPFVRPSLFLEMFAQDPDEWVCVDNVDAVGRWNIKVYGYQPPKPPSKQNYLNICRNAYHWRSDRFAVDAELVDLEGDGELERPPATTTLAGRNKSNFLFDDRFTMPVFAEWGRLTCVTEVNYGNERGLHPTGKKHLDVESSLSTFFVDEHGLTGPVIETAPIANYPAATLLRDLPVIRPAPDRGASRTRPALGFNDYPNSVMNGCSYKSIPKIERSACQAACAVDPACQGYSHNKLTQACELKHTLTARRLDPLWTSGAPSAEPAPGRSVRAEAMAEFRTFSIEKTVRLDGKLISEAKIESREACSDRCEVDAMCLAAETSGETCRLFSEVAGLRDASKVVFDVWFKKQQ